MQVLVVGANGMLGHDMVAVLKARGMHVLARDLPSLDVTRDQHWDDLPSARWVINCAAYTAVDRAEAEHDLAMAVNREGAGRVARWAASRNARMVHVSTDYVFDGTHGPYRESDPVAPLNVYGQSKLEGERAVLRVLPEALVVRTQALFGVHGRHFVGAIQRRLKEGPWPVRVVDDQFTCPTYTVHLARAIVCLMDALATGTVHVSACGQCSWWECACAIAAETGLEPKLEPIPTSGYPLPARRPANAVLCKDRYRVLTGEDMPDWRAGLKAFIFETSKNAGAGI